MKERRPNRRVRQRSWTGEMSYIRRNTCLCGLMRQLKWVSIARVHVLELSLLLPGQPSSSLPDISCIKESPNQYRAACILITNIDSKYLPILIDNFHLNLITDINQNYGSWKQEASYVYWWPKVWEHLGHVYAKFLTQKLLVYELASPDVSRRRYGQIEQPMDWMQMGPNAEQQVLFLSMQRGTQSWLGSHDMKVILHTQSNASGMGEYL